MDKERRINMINDMLSKPVYFTSTLGLFDAPKTKVEPLIRNVYANKKAKVVVVIFDDNEKMVFKLSKGDKWDVDKVILMATVRKQRGLNKSQYRKYMIEQKSKINETTK